MLRPKHFRRVGDILRVLVRFGFSSLVAQSGIMRLLRRRGVREPEPEAPAKPTARNLRLALEELGPTFVKLGQLLSTRPDLLPPDYIAELSLLQDEVAPFPFELVRREVERELGASLEAKFRHFEPTPRASASLAQVHDATLPEGTNVVVKVQRPNIQPQIENDLDTLKAVAAWLDAHSSFGRICDLPGMVASLSRALRDELDFRVESQNAQHMARILGGFRDLRVPGVFPDRSSRRVLTMERVEGVKLTALTPQDRARLRAHLSEELLRCYLKQIVVDGFFHADPHPGNFCIANDGRLAFLDFGRGGSVDERSKDDMLKLLSCFAEGEGKEAAELLIGVAGRVPGEQLASYRETIGQLIVRERNLPPRQMSVGKLLLEATQISFLHKVRIPSDIILLAETLLKIEHVCRSLDPDVDMQEVVRDYLRQVLLRRLASRLSLGRLVRMGLDTERLVSSAPSHVTTILEKLSQDALQLNLNMDLEEIDRLTMGMQKIANRIAFGIINGSIILGSALVMQTGVGPKLWGYPALALIGFLAAAGMGFYLLLNILLSDRR